MVAVQEDHDGGYCIVIWGIARKTVEMMVILNNAIRTSR